ncbi:putative leucine-rich repeat-containing protein DDB_G0290503 [Parasteatoda tepidariorum]|uniref:putative leucine-rich repeat-containing protein DDB_G0290503 n=1 Tax=Parasteatoda tepidariorum TaxID=114398 RepID=UPI0039BD4A30
MAYLLSLNHDRNNQSTVKEEGFKTSNENKDEIENNEKYKNLLEANYKENEKIQMKLNEVKKDIREVNRRLVEAEKLCALNRMNFRSLEKETRKLPKKSICFDRQKFAVDDASGKDFRIVLQEKIDKLGATKRENANLKNILLQEILLKTQDFHRFCESLQAMAAKYRSTIEQIRDKQNATEQEKESKK